MPSRRRRASRTSGGQVIAVRLPVIDGGLGRQPPSKAGTQLVESPAEPVAISMRHVFGGQVGEPAPGEPLQQIPGGAFYEVPRIRPERAAFVPVVPVHVTRQDG